MPLDSNLGGENTNREISKSENTDIRYLTAKQANYVYRKVESGNLINKNMMRQEIGQDVELDQMDDTSGDENLYRESIANNTAKIETTLSQMEQWSIPSNVINYVQYDIHPKNLHTISISPIKKVRNNAKIKQDEKKRPISEVEFNVINYVQYDIHPKNLHTISISPIKKVRNNAKIKQNEKKRPISEVEFKDSSDRLEEEYLDSYKGEKSEILNTTRC